MNYMEKLLFVKRSQCHSKPTEKKRTRRTYTVQQLCLWPVGSTATTMNTKQIEWRLVNKASAEKVMNFKLSKLMRRNQRIQHRTRARTRKGEREATIGFSLVFNADL